MGLERAPEEEQTMRDEADRDYHGRRARAELDLASRSTNDAAATAHRGLSSLHMRRAMALESPAAAGGREGDDDSAAADLAGSLRTGSLRGR